MLILDIGNTHIAGCVYKKNQMKFDFRIFTDLNKTCDEYFSIISSILQNFNYDINNIDKVAVSSVVPKLNSIIFDTFFKYLKVKPYFIKYASKLKTKVKININYPEELGADRLANAEYCAEKFKNTNVILIDFGTATTFDVIDNKSRYNGGIIIPGIKLSAESLFKKASKLFSVNYLDIPETIVCKNTSDCIKSGIGYGYSFMIKELIIQIKKEQNMKKCKIIGTGGYSSLIKKIVDVFDDIKPFLTLEGIKLIYEKNI